MKRLHGWVWSLVVLMGCGHTPDIGSEGQAPSLQQALVRAIQSQYVDEIDVSALQSLSVPEIMARLDRDSSLQDIEPSSLAFIRGFEQEGSVSRLTMLSNRIGYLRIGFFGRRTVQDVIQALEGLKPSPAGLIVDLRDNPGGRVETAIQLAELFLPEGVPLGHVRGRESDERSYVSTGPVHRAEPVIILINRGTASSAELFAGLLQHHRRARLVGTPTAGKNTVQAAIPLDHRHLLFLTTGRYLLPGGFAAASTGLRPDAEVYGEDTLSKAQSILNNDDSAQCETSPEASVPAQ